MNIWLAELLQKKLEVKPARESNVINIAYTGGDPDFAAAVANAFAQAYLDVNLDLKLAPARQYAAFFEEQTKRAATSWTGPAGAVGLPAEERHHHRR